MPLSHKDTSFPEFFVPATLSSVLYIYTTESFHNARVSSLFQLYLVPERAQSRDCANLILVMRVGSPLYTVKLDPRRPWRFVTIVRYSDPHNENNEHNKHNDAHAFLQMKGYRRLPSRRRVELAKTWKLLPALPNTFVYFTCFPGVLDFIFLLHTSSPQPSPFPVLYCIYPRCLLCFAIALRLYIQGLHQR